MSPPIERRVAALEAKPASTRAASAEEAQARLCALALRCGFTEAEVAARFGGWPRFAYAYMIGQVVDPARHTPWRYPRA